MNQPCTVEGSSVRSNGLPASLTRPRPHNSSSSSCSLLTTQGGSRVDGSPMLPGFSLSQRHVFGSPPGFGNGSCSPASPLSPPATVSLCSCCACYPRLVAKYPWAVLLVVFFVSTAGLVALIVVGDWPDFQTSPVEAFKTVNTPLSRRYEQLECLRRKTTRIFYLPFDDSAWNVTRRRRATKPRRPIQFCDSMVKQQLMVRAQYLSRIVVSDGEADQLSLASLRSQCSFQRSLRRLKAFRRSCVRSRHSCCPAVSLPNLVASLGGLSRCEDIGEREVNATRSLLSACLVAYRSQPWERCWVRERWPGEARCSPLPARCAANASHLFLLLAVVLPQRSLSLGSLRVPRSLSLLPLATGQSSLALYRAMERRELLGRVEGLQFDVEHLLVDDTLHRDSRWLAVGAAAIFLLVWLSTGSLFVSVVAHVLMALSLILAYFVYSVVLRLHYFPFVNVMTAVLAIAVGADDCLIFSRVWNQAKQRRDVSLPRLVSDAMRHAGLSVVVTSLSTAAALLANLHSNIVAVRCFALYSGLVVLVNLVLILACVPATWALVERCSLCPCRGSTSWLERIERVVYSHVFVRALPFLVLRLRHVWAALGLLLTVSSLVVIFYKPGFTFSSNNRPVFFTGRHPLQLYSQYREDFDFERDSARKNRYILILAWGALPSDRRETFVIDSTTPFTPDPEFDPESAPAQLFLRDLCGKLQSIPRALRLDGASPFHFVCPFSFTDTSAFGTFADYWSCANKTIPITTKSGCCWREKGFPFSRTDMRRCLAKYSEEVTFNSNSGLRFPLAVDADRATSLAGLWMQAAVNVSLDAPYAEVEEWLAEVDVWWKERMAEAPEGLKHGFYTSSLRHFDLQRNIARSLPLTVTLSIVIAAGVCLLTSLNLLLSVYALVTILAILACAVASFVLMGWRLDIVEAVVITLAVGLAVDFCLHYSVAYRVCRSGSRQERAREALVSVASPISAAALTTALAGAGMMATQLLVYRQMAVFLITLMAWAWFFSTFVFVALLALIGPTHHVSVLCRCMLKERIDKTIYSEVVLNDASSSNQLLSDAASDV